ncbi:putative oxidoreductase GLYR1 homolog, partial [Diaphorina citri]|uniref:Cytokine-like nuclear factor N-PAC n=2 Tax=Diaphorina citri TaxID=121845 RepID=A0A3Q0JQD8_DIACI
MCAQNCVNVRGSYECTCVQPEFLLRPDHTSCKAVVVLSISAVYHLCLRKRVANLVPKIHFRNPVFNGGYSESNLRNVPMSQNFYSPASPTMTKSNKSVSFKEACAAIEDYIANRGENDEVENEPEPFLDEADALFNKIKEESNTPVAAEKPKPKPKSVKKEYNNTSRGSSKRLSENSSSADSVLNSIKKKKQKLQASSLKENSGADDRLSYSPKVGLLARPANTDLPETPSLDLTSINESLKDKNINPSSLKFGFLGLGIMGSGIVKNLLNSGHSVIVWNRSPEKCDDFVKAGAEQGLTPSDVVQMADITFSCVADPQAAKDLIFGNCGVLSETTTSKGYVEMTGIDPETSQDIAEAIVNKGGRYLEAQIQGSKTQAEEGKLVILAAGDRSLFEDCQSCFIAMGVNSFYMGEVGNASKMNLVMQLMNGIILAGLTEGMALADRAGLKQKDLLEIISLTSLNCPMILNKGQAILDGTFPAHLPLTHLQKDLNLALEL